MYQSVQFLSAGCYFKNHPFDTEAKAAFQHTCHCHQCVSLDEASFASHEVGLLRTWLQVTGGQRRSCRRKSFGLVFFRNVSPEAKRSSLLELRLRQTRAAKSMPPLTRPQSISQQSDKCVLVNRATASVRQRGRFTKNTIKYLSPPLQQTLGRLPLMYLL